MRAVFVDVDTQLDFVSPAGALYVPGAESILNRVATMNRWAAEHEIQVLSTMDAHSENDPEFSRWPAHCVAGTLGQRKPEATLLDRRVVVASAPVEVSIHGTQQVIIEKQHLDCFTNANLPAILERINAERYVVYGVVTEYCVKCAAMGLLRRGKRVELVVDAVKSLSESESERTIGEFVKAGVVLTTTAEAIAPGRD